MTNMSTNHTVNIDGYQVDNNGNSYVVGDYLPEAPLNYYQGYNYDIFVSKFNSTGSMDFISYLGGSNSEYVKAMTIDSAGNIYILGTTGSTDFPTTDNTSKSASSVTSTFVAKFNNTGQLEYSTILGNYDEQNVHIHLVADNSGNLFITFQIYLFHTKIRIKNNFTNMLLKDGSEIYYLAKLDNSGQLIFSDTFPAVIQIATDNRSNCFIIGSTIAPFGTSNDFPDTVTTNFNVFILKLGLDGNLIFNHVIGGSKLEYPSNIGFDSAGNIYVFGITNSNDFPLKQAYYKSLVGPFVPFEVKLDPNGSILFSTYIDKVIDPYSPSPLFSIYVDRTGNSYFLGTGNDKSTFISKFNNKGEEQYTFNDTQDIIFKLFLNEKTNDVFLIKRSYKYYSPSTNPKPINIYYVCDSNSNQPAPKYYVEKLNETGNSVFSLYIGNENTYLYHLEIRSNDIYTISTNCIFNFTSIYLYRSRNIFSFRYNSDNLDLLGVIINIVPPTLVIAVLLASFVIAFVEIRKIRKEKNKNFKEIIDNSKTYLINIKTKMNKKKNKNSSFKKNLDLISEIIDENKDKKV